MTVSHPSSAQLPAELPSEIVHDAGYRAALNEIDQLMCTTEAGSPEDQRLDVLVTLVEKYESEHYPI